MNMAKKNIANIKRKIVNFFGGLGYLLSMFEWLFVIVIYTSAIKTFLTYITPTVIKPVVSPPPVFDIRSNLLIMIVAVIITVAAIILSIYVFVKTPTKVVQVTREAVHQSAEAITPVVLHVQHKMDTPKNHKKMVFNTAVLLKALIVVIPVIACFFSQFTDKQMLSFSITIYTSLCLAGLSALAFVSQYVLARLLSVKRQDVW